MLAGRDEPKGQALFLEASVLEFVANNGSVYVGNSGAIDSIV